MIHYRQVAFRYDPSPFGVVTSPFDEADYDELARTYPPLEAFLHHGSLGNRFSLSPRHNGRSFAAHLGRSPAWRELARWVATPEFVNTTLAMLLAHGVDLALSPAGRVTLARTLRRLRVVLTGRLAARHHSAVTELTFAMLPANGGSLLPHTDEPDKLVNLATTMAARGEWNDAVGGGTDINRPKDAMRLFNRGNHRLGFDEVDIVGTVPYRPNQMLVVVRSDASWHSSRPMTGATAEPWRKTVNINLVSTF